MIYALMGPPGCGKSTQAELLQQVSGMRFVSIGQMLRDEAEHNPVYAAYLAKGDLFPEEIIQELLAKLHQESPDNIIIDGALRRESESTTLVDLWGADKVVVILLNARDETLKLRSAARQQNRSDDTALTFTHRLELYRSRLPAILEHVRDYNIPILEIDAEPSIDAIHHDIMTKLQPYALPTKN